VLPAGLREVVGGDLSLGLILQRAHAGPPAMMAVAVMMMRAMETHDGESYQGKR
jgi:hypothetical protein